MWDDSEDVQMAFLLSHALPVGRISYRRLTVSGVRTMVA